MNYMNLASEYEVPDRRSYQPHFPRPPARGACVTALQMACGRVPELHTRVHRLRLDDVARQHAHRVKGADRYE